jgi:hypothetical protein
MEPAMQETSTGHTEKVKPDIENIRDLSLAVVKHVAVQVTGQPL